MPAEDRPPRELSPRESLDPEIYAALRAIAGRYLNGAPKRITLTPTALVHEAWLKLMPEWYARAGGGEHLKACLATAMRHILVDRSRSARAQHQHVTVTSSVLATDEVDLDLEALSTALERLERHDPRCARVVELRFFGGLTQQEVAEVLGTSVRTVQGDWAYARSWLLRELDV